MYEHVLVALDGSPAAETALDHAEALARAFGSRVTLLRVMVSPEALVAQTAAAGGPTVGDVSGVMDPTPVIEAEHSSAHDYLDALASRLRSAGVNVSSSTTVSTSGPAQLARVLVGPRPNCSLNSRTSSFAI